MKKFLISLTLFLFILFPFLCLAQTTTILTENTNLIILQNKVDLLESINIKILDTIYWALGGLITVMLAIVGLNFFQNFSLNNKKISTIKEEINNDLKEGITKLNEQNEQKMAAFIIKSKGEIKSEIQLSLTAIKRDISRIEDDYEDIKRENLIRSAFEYKSKGQLGYIINLTEVLKIDIKRGQDWRINESLDSISKCIDHGSFDSDSITELQRILDTLPTEYSVQKRGIESAMSLKILNKKNA